MSINNFFCGKLIFLFNTYFYDYILTIEIQTIIIIKKIYEITRAPHASLMLVVIIKKGNMWTICFATMIMTAFMNLIIIDLQTKCHFLSTLIYTSKPIIELSTYVKHPYELFKC